MGNGAIGKILYFWIFIIGALFFAKILGVLKDDKTTIIFCVAIAVVYVVFQLFKFLGREKREARKAANKPVVHKGKSKKKR